MNRAVSCGAARVALRAAHRWSRLLRACLLLALALSFSPALREPVAAAGPSFPTYVYVVVSGPASYDVMRNTAGKETRLSRVAVAGVGLTDVAARTAPDGGHVAIRVSGDRAGGSSLRLVTVQSSAAITVTLSRNSDVGIGAFAWSPDSRLLAYTVASPQRADADTGLGALWVVGADAKGAHRLAGSGPARLVGWSPDSSGLYYVRDDGDDSTPPDLWYMPLNGPALPVIRSSPAGLQYSAFAVAASPPAGGAPGEARIAGLAAGNLGPLSGAPNGAAHAPRARPAPADTPGVVVSDGQGAYHALPDLGEAYKTLAWNPAGTHLLYSGGKTNTAWFADVATGQRWRLPAAVNNLAPIAWSDDGRYAVLADASGAANVLITLDTAAGAITRTRYVGASPKPSAAAKNLPVPYVSQLWDTGIAFNGNWACGPTSVAMVLAYYGRLTPWPFGADQAKVSAQDRVQSHAAGAESGKLNLMDGALYGQYVTAAFTYKGRTFNAAGVDPSGRRAQGLYGTIVGNSSLAHWEVMIDVLNLYNLDTAYIPVTWSAITAQLDKGYPVVLGTTLTASGHILVARGYTANGYLLVNDPYGNRFSGYGGDDGGNIPYAWKKIPAKLAMVVRGTITPPATPTPTATPVPATATPAPATPTAPAATATPPPDAAHGVNTILNP
jgi:uncharacterized protein YvpB/WD40 repeat protein